MIESKLHQVLRPMGGHRVPGAQPGVVDALLRVLCILQDVLCNGAAVAAVFADGLRHGIFASLPVEIDDDGVVQIHRLLSFVRSLTLLESKKAIWFHIFQKKQPADFCGLSV